ncbi:MAG TPA: hypothetical protein VF519_05050 [Mycobacteriales bacterium]|jgi:hypothetical protein
MRRTLAAAVLAAVTLPLAGPAAADPADSCLDPLFTSSAPRFVYYNPEIGMYYVDVAAAESFARAQPGRATAAATCLAGAVPPTDGCVTAFLHGSYPSSGAIVTVDPDGRVVVDPHAEDPFVAAVVGNAAALAFCVV